jgi:F-type H+-transporting ATPase subunit delta
MAGDITTIARPYAAAVFERAQETGEFAGWSEALGLLADIGSNPDFAGLIDNPNVPSEVARDIVLKVAGDALSVEQGNLVKLLVRNDRLALLPELSGLFEEMRTAQDGSRVAQVRSAYALTKPDQQHLSDALAAKLGGSIELTVELDKSLIGGVEIRVGDLVIDGTIRGKLEKLATELEF